MKPEVSLTEQNATGSSQPAIPSNFTADLHGKTAPPLSLSLSPPPFSFAPPQYAVCCMGCKVINSEQSTYVQ